MKRRIFPGTFALAIFATGTAWAQSPAPPQQPAASPQVTPAAPDLAATMKALEDDLRSRGRITWTETIDFKDGHVQRASLSDEIMNVTAGPKTCSLRVVSQTTRVVSQTTTTGSPYSLSVYLEEISGVDVLTSEEVQNRNLHRVVGQNVQESIEPTLYSAVVNSWVPFALDFPTKDAAEQFATLLRESVKQCSAIPVTSKPGSPSLTETLNFIADKLSTQGHVASSGMLTKDIEGGGYSYIPVGRDVDIFQASPNPATCAMQIDAVGMGAAESRLSFRRIGKIEVMKFKDYAALLDASFLSQGFRITKAPPTFVLYITAPGGEPKELYFSDETLANREAKAINHAAELCGAGANKEPF